MDTSQLCSCIPSNSLNENLSICEECNQRYKALFSLAYTEPDCVFEHNWIGSISSSINEEMMHKHEIKRVIIASHECCMNFFSTIKYDWIRIPENEDHIFYYLNPLADTINKDSSGTLIIDTKGSKRSGAALAAYMIKYKNYTANEACQYITKERGSAFFPAEYETELKLYEKKCRSQTINTKGIGESNQEDLV